MSVYDDAKKAIQDLLSPEIQEIKGELRAVNTRVDALGKNMELQFRAINQRFDDLIDRLELRKRIENLEREREAKKETPAQ